MTTVLLVIHTLLALAIIGIVLIQKSEGGGLGMGSSGSGGAGLGGFLTGRGTANFLTRTTAVLAAAFMTTSVLLVFLSDVGKSQRSILDTPPGSQTLPLLPTPGETIQDQEPSVPVQ